MANEFDLQITDGDLAFGPDDEPRFLSGIAVVAQDVQHRLLESGLVAELVADDQGSNAVLARIAFEVEADECIRAGSAEASITADGRIEITARTLDGAAITQTLSIQG